MAFGRRALKGSIWRCDHLKGLRPSITHRDLVCIHIAPGADSLHLEMPYPASSSESNDPAFPPLDGSIEPLPGFIDFHAENNPNRPWVMLANEDGSATAVSFSQFADATHRIAHTFRPGRMGRDGEVVAIFVHIDTLLYLALLSGLIRAGIVPLPMSPRLAIPVVAALLQKTDCHRIITQASFLGEVDSMKADLAKAGYGLLVEELPSVYQVFSGLPSVDALPAVEPYHQRSEPAKREDIVMYLLSSGSTSPIPKALPQRQAQVLQWCGCPCLVQARDHGVAWGSFVPLPFHTMGVFMILYAPLVSGRPVGIFAPQHPELPVIPTPKNVLDACKATRSSGVAVPPTFLEAWAQSADDVNYLATMKAVIFAGGSLSEKNGKKLTDAGVPLFAVYGGTEFGAHTTILDVEDWQNSNKTKKTREDWAWMKLADSVNPRWVAQGDGTYELHFLTCDTHWPAIENLDGDRGYATSDLWVPHPSKPDLWKIIGRKDDVFCLSSGENVYAVKQEGHIVSDARVSGAVMFGAARNYCGVLVELKPEYAINPTDASAVTDMRENVWPIVDEANVSAMHSAKIAKEMIIFTDPAKPLPRAPKGTVIRKRSLELYAQEIDELYASVEESVVGQDFRPPASWEAHDVEAWLQEYVSNRSRDSLDISPMRDRFYSLHIHLLYKRVRTALERSRDTRLQALATEFTEAVILQHTTIPELAATIAAFADKGIEQRAS